MVYNGNNLRAQLLPQEVAA